MTRFRFDPRGTRFRIYQQPMSVKGFETPSIVHVDSRPGTIGPGPEDPRIRVIDAEGRGSRRWKVPYTDVTGEPRWRPPYPAAIRAGRRSGPAGGTSIISARVRARSGRQRLRDGSVRARDLGALPRRADRLVLPGPRAPPARDHPAHRHRQRVVGRGISRVRLLRPSATRRRRDARLRLALRELRHHRPRGRPPDPEIRHREPDVGEEDAGVSRPRGGRRRSRGAGRVSSLRPGRRPTPREHPGHGSSRGTCSRASARRAAATRSGPRSTTATVWSRSVSDAEGDYDTHEFSKLFTGAAFDVFVEIYERHLVRQGAIPAAMARAVDERRRHGARRRAAPRDPRPIRAASASLRAALRAARGQVPGGPTRRP